MHPTVSYRQRQLARRHLTATVQFFTVTLSDDVNPISLAQGTATNVREVAAMIQRVSEDRTEDPARTYATRDVVMWTDCNVHAQERFKVCTAGDKTLEGRTGTVLTVERSDYRSTRRLTARLDTGS